MKYRDEDVERLVEAARIVCANHVCGPMDLSDPENELVFAMLVLEASEEQRAALLKLR